MQKAVSGRQERLRTAKLLDVAMDLARGIDVGAEGSAYQRLVRAARSFALIANPRAAAMHGSCNDCWVETGLEAGRVVVRLSCGGNSVSVSGPRGQAALWSIDTIDASESEACSMLRTVARAWPPKLTG